MKALVVYNNYSGSYSSDKVTFICDKLRAKYEYIEKFASDGPKSISRKIVESGQAFDIIVAIGGDGSIHDAINGLMRINGTRPVLAYVPLGTCNDVGHSFGLNGKVSKTVDAILAGESASIDVFKANGEYFIYALAAGYLTEISYLAPTKNKKKIGKIAYYLEAIKHVAKKKVINLELESEYHHIRGTYSLVLALNTRYLAGFRIHRKGGYFLNDGTINITLIRKTHRLFNLIDFALFLLLGERYTHNILYFKTSNFKLKSDEIISFNADGEHLTDDKNLNVSVHKEALRVIVSPKIKNKYFKVDK